MKNTVSVLLLSLVPALAVAQPPAKSAPATKATPATPAAPAKGAPAVPATPAKDAKAPVVVPAAPPAAPADVKVTVDTFKGNWKFDATLSATGMPGMEKPFTGKMTFNWRPVAGNTAVSCDAKMAKTPMGPFDANFVIAYDPYSKSVRFRSVTNMLEVHDHSCKWNGLDLTCTPLKAGMGPGGDELTEDITMTFGGKGCDAGGAGTCIAMCKESTEACNAKCDIKTMCKANTVTFKSTSKMTNGGATIMFEGKGKK